MPDPQHKKLRHIVSQLQAVHSAVLVAIAVLRGQAADLDRDVAVVLQTGVADRLQEQIDALESLLPP